MNLQKTFFDKLEYCRMNQEKSYRFSLHYFNWQSSRMPVTDLASQEEKILLLFKYFTELSLSYVHRILHNVFYQKFLSQILRMVTKGQLPCFSKYFAEITFKVLHETLSADSWPFSFWLGNHNPKCNLFIISQHIF